MKKLFAIIILAAGLLMTNQVHAQWVTGGALGIDYRDGGYLVNLAPKIGYQYKFMEFGFAPFLQYRDKSNYLTYGSQLYAQATVLEHFLIHGEFQAANVYVGGIENKRMWVMGLPIGVGYKHKVSDKIYAYGLILYDFLYKEGYSPQKNPIIRGGITYSL